MNCEISLQGSLWKNFLFLIKSSFRPFGIFQGMWKTLKYSFFIGEIRRYPKKWYSIVGLSLLAAFIEAAFLGSFRYSLMNFENRLDNNIVLLFLLIGLGMLVLVWLRYLLNLSVENRNIELLGDLRQAPHYFNRAEETWSTKRESQIQMEQSFKMGAMALKAVAQLLVFIPLILFSHILLFGFLFFLSLPIVMVSARQRKHLKNQATQLRRSRNIIFEQLEDGANFSKTWTHSDLLDLNNQTIQDEFHRWSEMDLDLSLSEENNRAHSDLWNGFFIVLTLVFSMYGAHAGYYQFADLTLFYGALLLSYAPVKNLSLFLNTQTRVNEKTQLESYPIDDNEFPNIAQVGESILWPKAHLFYGDHLLISNLEFELKPGAHILSGVNGVGKTTLLKQISRDSHADQLIYLNQFPELPHPHLLASTLKTILSKSPELVDILELKPLIHKSGQLRHHFSGGERQRILLALSLSCPAQWYLLDEPLSSVDFKTRSVMFDKICNYILTHQMNILMVHHDLSVSNDRINFWNLDENGLSLLGK